jgi:alcohol dehydrogenase class IV
MQPKPEQVKLIGNKTVIVSAVDENSKALAQRMWYGLQRNGIQSSFIIMNTPYPVINEIQDSANLFRRTGAKSLITIGSGAVCDFGKVVRCLLETGVNVQEVMQKKTKLPTSKIDIPHISIASTASTSHFLPSALVLHYEEDVLVSLATKSPSVSHNYHKNQILLPL